MFGPKLIFGQTMQDLTHISAPSPVLPTALLHLSRALLATGRDSLARARIMTTGLGGVAAAQVLEQLTTAEGGVAVSQREMAAVGQDKKKQDRTGGGGGVVLGKGTALLRQYVERNAALATGRLRWVATALLLYNILPTVGRLALDAPDGCRRHRRLHRGCWGGGVAYLLRVVRRMRGASATWERGGKVHGRAAGGGGGKPGELVVWGCVAT